MSELEAEARRTGRRTSILVASSLLVVAGVAEGVNVALISGRVVGAVVAVAIFGVLPIVLALLVFRGGNRSRWGLVILLALEVFPAIPKVITGAQGSWPSFLAFAALASATVLVFLPRNRSHFTL